MGKLTPYYLPLVPPPCLPPPPYLASATLVPPPPLTALTSLLVVMLLTALVWGVPHSQVLALPAGPPSGPPQVISPTTTLLFGTIQLRLSVSVLLVHTPP